MPSTSSSPPAHISRTACPYAASCSAYELCTELDVLKSRTARRGPPSPTTTPSASNAPAYRYVLENTTVSPAGDRAMPQLARHPAKLATLGSMSGVEGGGESPRMSASITAWDRVPTPADAFLIASGAPAARPSSASVQSGGGGEVGGPAWSPSRTTPSATLTAHGTRAALSSTPSTEVTEGNSWLEDSGPPPDGCTRYTRPPPAYPAARAMRTTVGETDAVAAARTGHRSSRRGEVAGDGGGGSRGERSRSRAMLCVEEGALQASTRGCAALQGDGGQCGEQRDGCNGCTGGGRISSGCKAWACGWQDEKTGSLGLF